MRFLNRQFLRNRMEVVSASHVETLDGMVYDVNVAERYCRVRIQGVSNLVKAYFPQNWVSVPWYVKQNNSVRVAFVGGKGSGNIEITGPGLTVPTSTAGGSQIQSIPAGENTVLTGCELVQSPNNPRMVVLCKVGTYRIGGVALVLGPISGIYGDSYQLGDGGLGNTISGAIGVNSAPSVGNFRYDTISVGSDGIITYTPGVPSSSPVIPDVPTGKVALPGSPIFIPFGTISIYNGVNIGVVYSSPVPAQLTITIGDDDLAWAELTTDIEIAILDQYGNAINGTGSGYYITLEFLSGNGTVHSDEEGDSTTIIGGHTGTGNSYTFTYVRDQLDPGDVSPALKAVLHIDPILQTGRFITLRDAGGGLMI